MLNNINSNEVIIRKFKGNAFILGKFNIAKMNDEFYVSQSDLSKYITGSTKNSLRTVFRLKKEGTDSIKRIKVEKTNYVKIDDLIKVTNFYLSKNFDTTKYRKIEEYENIKKVLSYLKMDVLPVCERLKDRFERLGKDFDAEMDRGMLDYYYYATAINGANDKSKRYYVIKDENGEYFFELKQILYDIGWQLTTRNTDSKCNAVNAEHEVSKENYKLCKTVVLIKGKGSPYINAKGLEELFSYSALSVYYDTIKTWYKDNFLKKYPEGDRTVFNDNKEELDYLKKDYNNSTPLMKEEIEALADIIEKDETMRTIPEIADVISDKRKSEGSDKKVITENSSIRSTDEDEYRRFARKYINKISLENQKGEEKENSKSERMKVTLELDKSLMKSIKHIIKLQNSEMKLEDFLVSMINKSFNHIQNIIEEEQKAIDDLHKRTAIAIKRILGE